MHGDLLGYDEDGLPIWAMFGAEGETEGEDDAEGTEDGDAEEDGEDDDTEDEDTTEDAKGEKRKQPRSAKAKDSNAAAKKASAYRPPSQAEWNRTQAALKKANDEQRAARKAALEKARKEGMDEAATTAREKALEEADKTWKPRVVRTEAKAELIDMGCSNPTRLIKLIDQDKVTIQEDGSLLGLEAQLHELKDEWPELFRKVDDTKKPGKKEAPPAKKVGAAAGSSKKDEGEEKKTSGAAALVAARLLGTSA